MAFVGGEGGNVVDVNAGGDEEDAFDCVGHCGGWEDELGTSSQVGMLVEKRGRGWLLPLVNQWWVP